MTAMLRNLLARNGYPSIDAIRDEGREQRREEGRKEGLQRAIAVMFAARFGSVPPEVRRVIDAASDAGLLERWIALAATGAEADVVRGITGSP